MNIYTVNYILSRLSFAMAAALAIPLVLAIIGGCMGSAAGGFRISRQLVLL